MMNKVKQLFEKFCETGRVEDYLAYTKAKKENANGNE